MLKFKLFFQTLFMTILWSCFAFSDVIETALSDVIKTTDSDVVETTDSDVVETADSNDVIEITDEAPKEQEHWVYEVEVSIDTESGNSDSFNSSISLSATLSKPKSTLEIYASNTREEEDDEKETDETILGSDYISFIHEQWGWFSSVELKRDKFDDLNLRATAALGLNYHCLKTNTNKLELRGGVGFRYDNYVNGGNYDSSTAYIGLKQNWQFAEWGVLTNDIVFTPSIKNVNDFLLSQDIGVEIPIGKSDSCILRIGFSNSYNSTPPANKRKSDTEFYSSLILSWE
jgi:putative salt-induced outer membrane protein